MQLLLFVYLCCFYVTNGFGALLGGSSCLREEEFLDPVKIGFDFKGLIDNSFITDVKGSNQLPMSYFSYICGTKQVSVVLRNL